MPIRNVITDILPLFPEGESSPMYVDTRLRSAPTPMPVTNLHIESVIIPVANASPNDPIAINTMVSRSVFNRPCLSANLPMVYEPIIYPISPTANATKRLSDSFFLLESYFA
jgi:hypothetical protein